MKLRSYVFFALLACSPLRAEQVTLTPTQDRDVYQGTGLPTGTDYSLGVSSSGAFGGGHSQKSIIQFNVTGTTTGMTAEDVGSAKLRLYVLPPEVYPSGSDIGGNILISYQTGAWTESGLRWATFSPGAIINTLTLVADRPYNDGQGTTIYAINTWVEVDVTSAVKAWLSGTQVNYGFLLAPDETNSPYLSSAFADSVGGWKPQLIITRAEPPLEFKVTSFSFEGSNVTLTWNSRAGRRYVIKESPDLKTWEQVREVDANSAITTSTFTGTSFAEKQAFYIVEELPAAP